MASERAIVNGDNDVIPRKMSRMDEKKPVTVVLGTQWGDEGKGKVVDMLATKADICCRCQVSRDYQCWELDASIISMLHVWKEKLSYYPHFSLYVALDIF